MPANGWLSGNVSIRTQVRLLEGTGIDLGVRRHPPSTNPYVYFAGVDRVGCRHSPRQMHSSPCSVSGVLGLADTRVDLDLTQDVVLQFDVMGNQLHFWAWQAGGKLPETPLLTAVDDALADGRLWIAVASEDSSGAQQLPASAAFRYVTQRHSQFRCRDRGAWFLLVIAPTSFVDGSTNSPCRSPLLKMPVSFPARRFGRNPSCSRADHRNTAICDHLVTASRGVKCQCTEIVDIVSHGSARVFSVE